MSKEKRGEKRMKEEDTLLKKLGKENSFKVPEGYFENLTSEVMNKLPEKEKVAFKEEPVSTWTRLKPLLYMAAMFIGAALIIRVASTDHKSVATDDVAVTEVVDTEVISDEMIDVALDRAMLDIILSRAEELMKLAQICYEHKGHLLDAVEVDPNELLPLILECAAEKYKTCSIKEADHLTITLKALFQAHSNDTTLDRELFERAVKQVILQPDASVQLRLLNDIVV